MKIQLHSYFNIPYNSICNLSARWVLQLANAGFDIKVSDYSGHEEPRFEEMAPFLGIHDPPAPVGIYIGYPSHIKTIGNLISRNLFRVGVFTTETNLAEEQVDFLSPHGCPYNLICVPSAYCKTIFSRTQPCNVIVINHGLDESMQPMMVDKKEKFTFLFVFSNSSSGGTTERKGLNELIDAFRIVRKSHDVNLLIKTSGNIDKNTKKLESKNEGLMFDMRLKSRQELTELYNSCHVYINPSRAEGFGITPLEAMACGIPVVSPIHSGLTEYLNPSNCVQTECEKSKHRFNYATNNGPIWDLKPKDIARAMIKAHDKYSFYSKNAIDYSEYIRERFSWKNVMAPLVDWLNRLNVPKTWRVR